MRKYLSYIIVAAIIAATLLIICQSNTIGRLTKERDKCMMNTEALLSDVEIYRTRDSLSGAKVQALELTVKEFERFRAEDARLIQSLRAKNRDLAAVNKTQSQTIINLRAIPRDTLIIRDSIPIAAVAVHCGDAWYNFDGLLTKDEFSGRLEHRDSLVLFETVKYKRFLGFLWKTKEVQDRQLDCVTKSPHNNIMGLEYIVIEE